MKSKVLLTLVLIALVCSTVPAHSPDQPAESAEQIRPLLVGAEVPPLTLRTSDGAELDLNVSMGERPTLLIFYRGGW